MEKMKDRIYWLDWLKVFGMCLVVYAHIDTQSLMNRFIFSFHMALFFMISGFLNKRRDFKDECKVVFRSLFIPYFIFSSLLILLCSGPFVKYFFYISIGSLEEVPLLIRPLWFVYSLAIIRLIASLLGSSSQRSIIAAVVCICAFIALLRFNLIPEDTDLFQINTTLMAFPFFIFGVFLKKYFKFITKYKVYIMLLSLPFFYFAIKNGDVNMFRCAPGNNLVLFYLNAAFISVFFILLFETFFNKMSNEVIKTTSMGLIIVLASHLFITEIIDKYTFHTLHPAILTILVMVVGFVLSWITLRYFPFILGKPLKRKGRKE